MGPYEKDAVLVLRIKLSQEAVFLSLDGNRAGRYASIGSRAPRNHASALQHFYSATDLAPPDDFVSLVSFERIHRFDPVCL